MGIAKYYEDNLEIIFDRLFMMTERERCTQPKYRGTVSQAENKNICEAHHSESNYEDMYIICRDCGTKFVFSAHSQKYFDAKKWESPKRCKHCRDIRTVKYLMCASF